MISMCSEFNVSSLIVSRFRDLERRHILQVSHSFLASSVDCHWLPLLSPGHVIYVVDNYQKTPIGARYRLYTVDLDFFIVRYLCSAEKLCEA